MARKNRGADLLEGFAQGMQLAGAVKRVGEESAIKDELAQLSATAANDATAEDPAQASAARAMAQAGVLEKHGRLEDAQRLRSQALQGQLATLQIADTKARGERAKTEFEWQTTDRARLDKDRAREDEWKAGRTAAFQSTAFAQKEGAYNKSMESYNKAKADYDSAVERGDTTAVAPVAPAKPSTSIGETLRDHATILAHDIAYNKASPDDVLKFQQMRKNVEDEGYGRALKLAQSGAPLTAVVAEMNRTGEHQIDPASIVSDKQVTREGGVKSRVITMRSPDGRTQTIDTYAELTAIGQGDKVFEQAVKLHSMSAQDRQAAISGGHLALAQRQYNDQKPEREAKDEEARLRVKLAQTEDPKEQARLSEKIAALRTGTRSGAARLDPVHVKEARAMVEAGAAPDMATALEAVIGKGDRVHQSYVESAMKRGEEVEGAVAQANKLMTSTGYTQHGGRWVKTGAKGKAPSAAAVAALRANPDRVAEFEDKFGAGSARAALANDGAGVAGR